MEAFHRLQVRPRLDGSASLVLLHLCWRHDSKKNAAWPSLERMARDLDMNKSTLIEAINRLQAAGLVSKHKGGGRGRSNLYRLPFLRIHETCPDESPLIWNKKRSGPPDDGNGSDPPNSLDERSVRWSTENSPAEDTRMVRPAGLEKNKNIKALPAGAERRAGDDDWQKARQAALSVAGLAS